MQAQANKEIVLARRCEIIHPKYYVAHKWVQYGLYDIVEPI